MRQSCRIKSAVRLFKRKVRLKCGDTPLAHFFEIRFFCLWWRVCSSLLFVLYVVLVLCTNRFTTSCLQLVWPEKMVRFVWLSFFPGECRVPVRAGTIATMTKTRFVLSFNPPKWTRWCNVLRVWGVRSFSYEGGDSWCNLHLLISLKRLLFFFSQRPLTLVARLQVHLQVRRLLDP